MDKFIECIFGFLPNLLGKHVGVFNMFYLIKQDNNLK